MNGLSARLLTDFAGDVIRESGHVPRFYVGEFAPLIPYFERAFS